MKKKSLLLTLSLVTTLGVTLVSCGGEASNTSSAVASSQETSASESVSSSEAASSSSSLAQEVTRVVISKLEGYASVGDVINLEDHVKLYSGAELAADQTNFTATISDATLGTVSGHELTIIAEGDISVTIKAGSKNAKFTCTALSETKKEFADYIDGIGANYTLELINVDSDGNVATNEAGNAVLGSGMDIIHTTNYFAYDTALFGGSGYEGMIAGGDGDTYEFTATDRFGTGFEVQQGGSGHSYSAYYVSQDLPINVSNATTSVSTSTGTEYLIIDQAAATNFVKYGMAVSYKYTVYALMVEFAPLEYKNAAGETKIADSVPLITVMLTDGTNVGAGETVALLNADTGAIGMTPADEYVAAKKYPEAITDPGVATKVKAIADSKNYTEQFMSGWVDGDNKTIALPDSAANLAGLFPTLEGSVSATEDGIAQVISAGELEGAKRMVSKKEGGLEAVTNFSTDADGKPVVSDTYTATAVEGTDPWAVVSNLTGADGDFAGAKISSVKTDSNLTQVVVNDGASIQNFMADLLATIPFYGASLAANYIDTGLFTSGDTVASFFSATIQYNETALSVLFNMTWEDGEYFNIAFMFSNVGTTVLPTDIVVTPIA